jgi:hypothetical protein
MIFEKQWKEIDGVQIEASVEIEGDIKEEKRAPTGLKFMRRSLSLSGEQRVSNQQGFE